jgi:hypothetical protein
MPKNACSQIISGNFQKNLPTSLFAEKVSMTLLALGYQANESNKFTLLKEKEPLVMGKDCTICLNVNAPVLKQPLHFLAAV